MSYKHDKSNPMFGDRRKVDKYERPLRDTLYRSGGLYDECAYVDYPNVPSQCSGYRESVSHHIQVYNDRRSRERSAINHLIAPDVCVNVGYGDDETRSLVSLSSDKRRSLDCFNCYVDTVTGALCRVPYASYKTAVKQRNDVYRTKQKESLIKFDKVTEHHKIDGVWYEIKFTSYEPVFTRFYAPFYTNRQGRSMYIEQVRYPYPLVYDVLKMSNVTEKRVATTSRTLSRKRLKQFKLV